MLDYSYLDDINKQVLVQRANNTAELVLLKRIAFQNRDAFHEIFALYYPQLQHFISLLIRSEQQVDEISNDVMIEVWQKAACFNGQLRFSTWIFGIAYKKTLKSIKNLTLTNSAIEKEYAQPPQRRPIAEFDVTQHTLLNLTIEHQAVVLLTYVYGYSASEIAQIMACPLKKVESRLLHARVQLQEKPSPVDTEYETERR